VLAEEFIVRSVKPLTFPKEFRFATEARSRRCPCWSVFVLYSLFYTILSSIVIIVVIVTISFLYKRSAISR
jgi:hypothetical protein